MRYDYEFDSFDDCVIKGYKWVNDHKPKCIVVLSHGMAETIERYDAFANFLLERDVFVYGHSHRGHGKTAVDIEHLGYLGENGWMKMKEDLRKSVEMARTDYFEAPIVLFGHSMGSFLSRDFLLDYSYLISGIVLSGTGFVNKMDLQLGKWISSQEVRRKGVLFPSKIMNSLTFGKFNNKIEHPKTAFDWLSRDHDAVEKYILDPYCGAIHPSSFYYEFSMNLFRILYTDIFKNLKENLPMLLLSGEADPVGNYGKGVIKTEKYYKEQGFLTDLKFYTEGRHEMLNEINSVEVFEDIYKWIKYKIIK